MKLHPRESVILVEDYQAMVEWYQHVLGFKVAKTFEGEYHYCNLENEAGIRLGIAPAKEMGVTPADRRSNTVVLQFEVKDVKALFEHLQHHGGAVTFGPSFDEKDRFWYGGFSDPEGNPFWVVDRNCP